MIGIEVFLAFVVTIQILLGVRVLYRLISTAGGPRIQFSNNPNPARVTVLLPVLNEAARIEPCLESLVAQPEEVAEILVVDGGSEDETQFIVKDFTNRDARVKLVDASPVPQDWTGKVWGLEVGLSHANSSSQWILCVDADVVVAPFLVRSLLAHSEKFGLRAFSVATRQRLSGAAEGLLHPSMLATLVYRFGIPGATTRKPTKVQANGQCFLAQAKVLLRCNAFFDARASLCEDVTIARRIADYGEAVGFYEGGDLAEVSMYSSFREAWDNWPRSLAMRDHYFGFWSVVGLLEVFFVQALPLPLLLVATGMEDSLWIIGTTLGLTLMRLGVLTGIARAYVSRPWSYWISFLCDLPVAIRLLYFAVRRRHAWRGRIYVRRRGGRFEVLDGP